MSITYTSGTAHGVVSIYWHEETHHISYVSVKVETSPASDTNVIKKWLLITSTSVKHVIKEGASACPLWLEMERTEEDELDADICCDDWKSSIDPTKQMTMIEKRYFAFVEAEGNKAGKNKQITILREMLASRTKKYETKIRKLEDKVRLLEKLLAGEKVESASSVNLTSNSVESGFKDEADLYGSVMTSVEFDEEKLAQRKEEEVSKYDEQEIKTEDGLNENRKRLRNA